TLPHSFFEKSRTGDLTSRIAKDPADIQDILESMITVFIRSIPTILGILFVSFMLDWIYSLTFVFVIPLVFWANVIFTGRTKNAIRRQRRIEGGIASSVQEVLYYHKAVATLSLEGGVVESFLANGRQSAYHGVQAGRFQGFLTGIIDLLVGLSTVLVLFVGVMRIIHGCLTVGQLMVFLTYLNSLFKPIREISKFTGRMAKSTAALERVEEIMHLKPLDIGATDLPHASEAPPLRGDIEFSSVSFGYGGEVPVLKEFSLSIPAGTKVAIVGASGSGKSTVLQMLMRLYDPERGKICIDAIDIRTLKLSSLRSQMAIVLQDSFIFNMSIADNIALAKPGASEQEILEAARQAEADEFISELPAGYETVLGEGGTGLSGGQKRRLAIARAFLRDAPIILLDEPTTGLDAASEKKVVEAIARLSKGRTTLLVTHQLSAAVDADLIVVVDRGEIVQCGTYEDLAGREGYFRELWSIQQG
ncbi:MAG: ABC transporter ATP-binding protein, partial [Syntrophobacteraceae bacterium]